MPDAWDDDWIEKGTSKPTTSEQPPTAAKLSKAERRAKQAEFNRQLWEDADNNQEENYFLKTRGIVPLKSEFKPAVKVLSRKPAPKQTVSADGIAQLNIDDDEDDDEAAKNIMTPEERKQKAQREREEKQKAYEARRQELFGNNNSIIASKRGGGSPRNQSRGNRLDDSRPSSSASNRNRQLFDPSESAKAEHLRPQKMEPRANDIQPTREPRQPHDSGRGIIGSAPLGGHST